MAWRLRARPVRSAQGAITPLRSSNSGARGGGAPVAVRREALQQLLLLLGRQLGRAAVGRQPPRALPQHDLRRALAEQARARRAVAAAAPGACLYLCNERLRVAAHQRLCDRARVVTVCRCAMCSLRNATHRACRSREADHRRDGTCNLG